MAITYTTSKDNKLNLVDYIFWALLGVTLLGALPLLYLNNFSFPLMVWSAGILFSVPIVLLSVKQLFLVKSPQPTTKERGVINRNQMLLAEEKKLREDLKLLVINSANKTVAGQHKASSKSLYTLEAGNRISENRIQLQKNQLSLEAMSPLLKGIQESKDRMLLRQVEYFLKLDELEKRLVISENGIELR